MEKRCLFIVCMLVFCLLFTGCDFKRQSNSPINYQRRLEKYLPSDNNTKGGTVDLSEGPKTRYEAKFGPKDLDFDIKLNTHY